LLQLESIHLVHVRVPLREPFVISSGAVSEKDAILVEVRAGGLCGLGEASPMAGAFYSHQTPESSWRVLTEQLVPLMNAAGELDLEGRWLGQEQAAAAFPRLGSPGSTTGDPFAVCGIDTALWNLAARHEGVPLWKLLGGDEQRAAGGIESGLAVGILPATGELLERIEHYLSEHGYRRVKIKVQPGWDVEPLTAVRERLADVPLMVDANCAYGREEIEHIAGWDRFQLMMIEQPLPRDDLEGHAELARRCRTPICLDEGAESVAAVQRGIELKAARILNIKLQRLGTLAAALRVCELAREAGIDCWVGTMPELGIGAHAAMHLATLPNIVFPTDVEASERWFVADVTEPPVRCRDGLLALPPGPGLGIELNRDVVGRYKIRDWSAPLNCRLSSSFGSSRGWWR
jgi:o-succinylbenzoate synthase